jgi:hypothetical protein
MNWLDILSVGGIILAALIFVITRVIKRIRGKKPSCCS